MLGLKFLFEISSSIDLSGVEITRVACIWSMCMKRCHAKKIPFEQIGCLSNLAILFDMCIDSAYAGNSTCTTACAKTIQYFAYTM